MNYQTPEEWSKEMHRLRKLKGVKPTGYDRERRRKLPIWYIGETLGVHDNTVLYWIKEKRMKSCLLPDVIQFIINNPKYRRKFLLEK